MLDISSFDISAPTMKAFDELYTYWSSLRDGNKIPLKSNFDPMKVMSILPEIAIMERVDDDTVIYRLAGTALSERAGREMTGINTLDNFPGEAKKYINEAYAKSAAQPSAGHHKVILNYEHDASYEVNCLYLPLCDDEEVIRYHIVLLYVEDKAKIMAVTMNKFIGYKVPRVCYPDIGFGTPACDDIPDHLARLD